MNFVLCKLDGSRGSSGNQCTIYILHGRCNNAIHLEQNTLLGGHTVFPIANNGFFTERARTLASQVTPSDMFRLFHAGFLYSVNFQHITLTAPQVLECEGTLATLSYISPAAVEVDAPEELAAGEPAGRGQQDAEITSDGQAKNKPEVGPSADARSGKGGNRGTTVQACFSCVTLQDNTKQSSQGLLRSAAQFLSRTKTRLCHCIPSKTSLLVTWSPCTIIALRSLCARMHIFKTFIFSLVPRFVLDRFSICRNLHRMPWVTRRQRLTNPANFYGSQKWSTF